MVNRCAEKYALLVKTRSRHLCVDKSHMPRAHFIKVFPGNETNLEWLKHEIASAKTYGAQLMRAAPAIIEEQQKLIDMQTLSLIHI